jgi:hypothetical protein
MKWDWRYHLRLANSKDRIKAFFYRLLHGGTMLDYFRMKRRKESEEGLNG